MMIKCRHEIFWIGTWSFKFLWCWNLKSRSRSFPPKTKKSTSQYIQLWHHGRLAKIMSKNTHTHTSHRCWFWPFLSVEAFPPWNSHGFWCFFCCMFCCHENWNGWILIKNWVTVLLPQALPCHSLRWNLGASHGLGINLDRWFDLDIYENYVWLIKISWYHGI